jgi:hypothetical protein
MSLAFDLSRLYTFRQEWTMQIQIMTLDEKITIGLKALELKKQGKIEEYERTMKSLPMPPYLARAAKKFMGADFLIDGGWNLTEADAEYGSGWISK